MAEIPSSSSEDTEVRKPPISASPEQPKEQKVEAKEISHDGREFLQGNVEIIKMLEETKSPFFHAFHELVTRSSLSEKIKTTLDGSELTKSYFGNIQHAMIHMALDDLSKQQGITRGLGFINNTLRMIGKGVKPDELSDKSEQASEISPQIEAMKTRVTKLMEEYLNTITATLAQEKDRAKLPALFQNTGSIRGLLQGKTVDQALATTLPIQSPETKSIIVTMDTKLSNLGVLQDSVFDKIAGMGVFGESILKFLRKPPISTLLAFLLGVESQEDLESYLDSEMWSRKSFLTLLSFGKDGKRSQSEKPIPFLEKVDMRMSDGKPVTRTMLGDFYKNIKEWKINSTTAGFWQSIFSTGKLEFSAGNTHKRIVFPGLDEMIRAHANGVVAPMEEIMKSLNEGNVEDIPVSTASASGKTDSKPETPAEKTPPKFEDLRAGDGYEFVGEQSDPTPEQKQAKIGGQEVVKTRKIQEKGKPNTIKTVSSIGEKIYFWDETKKTWTEDPDLVISNGAIMKKVINLTGKPDDEKKPEAKPAEAAGKPEEGRADEKRILQDAFEKAPTFPFTYTVGGKEKTVSYNSGTGEFMIGDKKYTLAVESTLFSRHIAGIQMTLETILIKMEGLFAPNITLQKSSVPIAQIFALEKRDSLPIVKDRSLIATFQRI